MDLVTILAIAVGLSMDAFAAAIAHGVELSECRLRRGFWIALSFGFFQAAMPVAGWALGYVFREFIESVDHWIAFGLLAAVGLKMIYEALEDRPLDHVACSMRPGRILMLSIATSIDALAVGLTFSLLSISIVAPVLIIGGVTFLISFMGICLSGFLGRIFGRNVEIAGGAVLIAIGLKILAQHLFHI
jgi:putative Mn2+ efflux pump MntP